MQQSAAQSMVLDHLGRSALDLAFVTTAVQVPTLLLMLYGGVAADRFKRRWPWARWWRILAFAPSMRIVRPCI